MNRGIYCIENVSNGKIYIGQSKNIEKRLLNHKRLLRTAQHSNKTLQNSFNKSKEDNFSFRIIEKTDDLKLLNELENKWISHYKSFAGKKGFNIQYPTKVFRLSFLDIFSVKQCASCNDSFVPIRRLQKFCSPKCRITHWKKNNEPSNSIEQRLSIIENHEKRISTIEKHLGLPAILEKEEK